MTDWSDHSSANPVEDFCAMVEHVAQSGYRPAVLIVSPEAKREYERFLKCQEVLLEILSRTSRRHLLRRYVLRRLKGESRIRIIAPRLDQIRAKMRSRYQDFKHRNDPYWDY